MAGLSTSKSFCVVVRLASVKSPLAERVASWRLANIAAVGCTLWSRVSLSFWPFANASLLRRNSFLADRLEVGCTGSIRALCRAFIAARVGFSDRIYGE